MLQAETTIQKKCPCGSGKPFQYCCEPVVSGQKKAPTAEALMRSRYTAFSIGAIDYLIDTTAPEQRSENDAIVLADQIKQTVWTGLRILDKALGGQNDSEGMVEFEAQFETCDQNGILHEKSNFRRENEQWLYVDGEVELRTSETT